jgi:hypothetical protein
MSKSKLAFVRDLVIAVALVAACDEGVAGEAANPANVSPAAEAESSKPDSPSSNEPPTEDEAPEPSAVKATEETSSEPCRELATAAKKACKSQLESATDLGCASALQGLKGASEQADGNLFGTGTDAQNRKAADAQCRSFLRSLQKKLDKVGEVSSISWGPQCKRYIESIDQGCLGKVDQGEVASSCLTDIVGARRILTADADASETSCSMMNQAGG